MNADSQPRISVHALRPLGLGYIEQPVARRDLEGMAEIRREARGSPVMADEGLFTLQDAYGCCARICLPDLMAAVMT